MKRKQFLKGINQLSEEGAIQVFKQIDLGIEEFVVGAVGVLQFEVLEYRLLNEYGVKIRMQQLPLRFARWIKNEGLDPKTLNLTSGTMRAEDKYGRFVLIFENEWSIRWAEERNEGLSLYDISK
jgi:peptide chain release factor 3